MLYNALATLALAAAVIALPTKEDECPQTLCVDGVNSCGVSFGGCYDACQSGLRPTPAPCSSSTSSSSTSTDNCSTRTVCADYINECGVWYGGCFPDCTPWPTFTAPPCTSTSTSVSATKKPCGNHDSSVTTTSLTPSVTVITTSVTIITPTPITDCHSLTVCEDFVNECGQTYGMKFDHFNLRRHVSEANRSAVRDMIALYRRAFPCFQLFCAYINAFFFFHGLVEHISLSHCARRFLENLGADIFLRNRADVSVLVLHGRHSRRLLAVLLIR